MEEEVITTSFVKRLVKEIEELREINEQHKKINGELRDTINKAIEYIKKNTKEGIIKDKRYFYSPEQAQDILEILDKGE